MTMKIDDSIFRAYDEYGQRITEEEDVLDSAFYVYIGNLRAFDYFHKITDNSFFGEITKIGYWRYDCSMDTWVAPEQDLDEITYLWKPFQLSFSF